MRDKTLTKAVPTDASDTAGESRRMDDPNARERIYPARKVEGLVRSIPGGGSSPLGRIAPVTEVPCSHPGAVLFS